MILTQSMIKQSIAAVTVARSLGECDYIGHIGRNEAEKSRQIWNGMDRHTMIQHYLQLGNKIE